MHFRHINAILLHAWYHFRHSRETWVDMFWFPVIHTISISGLTIFFGSQGGSGVTFTALAVMMWYMIEVGSYSIAVGTLWEVWSRSFSTLFISPVTITEFAVGQVIFSMFKQVLLLSIMSIIVYVAFGFSLLSLGGMLPVYLFLLALYGWAFGFIALGLILRFGTTLQSLAWGLVYMLQPLIGIFYPYNILPVPIQRVASLLAPTYVYETARVQLATGVIHAENLWRALGIDIVTLAVAYLFMRQMWEWARKSGALARIEQ